MENELNFLPYKSVPAYVNGDQAVPVFFFKLVSLMLVCSSLFGARVICYRLMVN